MSETPTGRLDYSNPASDGQHATSPLIIALAWLVVAIPLAWGVSQTAITSAKLFQSAPPAPAPPAVHPATSR
jgi:hypothetical protein